MPEEVYVMWALPEGHSRKNEKVADEEDDPGGAHQQRLPEDSAPQECPLPATHSLKGLSHEMEGVI